MDEKMSKDLTREAEEYLGKDEHIIASYKEKYFATEKKDIDSNA